MRRASWVIQEVGCHSFLQGIFPTQGLNPDLLHCRQILYTLSYQESPGLSRWNLKPETSVIVRARREIWDRNRRRGDSVTSEAEAGVMQSHSHQMPAATQSWRRQGMNSPLESLERRQPCQNHDFRLLASSTVKESFCCLKSPISANLLQQPQKLTHISNGPKHL